MSNTTIALVYLLWQWVQATGSAFNSRSKKSEEQWYFILLNIIIYISKCSRLLLSLHPLLVVSLYLLYLLLFYAFLLLFIVLCIMYLIIHVPCTLYSQYYLYLLIVMHSNRMIDDAGLYESCLYDVIVLESFNSLHYSACWYCIFLCYSSIAVQFYVNNTWMIVILID